ncbi:class I SAM-dependent methyltransferase [Pseudonocardia hispaniensis]|uniref:Class I SAM-dependent methyltransferase n=1 Tax=Pseudonocardia hispaniensis TaxID=904933 RepID=A0ABW1IWP3_9PSEU
MPHDHASDEYPKADFSRIYDRPDPRPYFETLEGVDYRIPQEGLPVVAAVLDASARSGRPRTVLDVCCSYGINAGLLRFGVDLAQMRSRYTDPALAGLSSDELAAADREFYAARPRRPDLAVLGVDSSVPAVRYGVRAGLMTGGWGEDLETADPSPGLTAGLRDVGLIISTGGVGYVGVPTFDRLLGAIADPGDIWAVIFVLRIFGYGEITELFARYGLVTEKVPGATFRQRRFADRAEQEAAVTEVVRRGLDPAGKEADGWYHAECFITRPADAAARIPIADLVAGA